MWNLWEVIASYKCKYSFGNAGEPHEALHNWTWSSLKTDMKKLKHFSHLIIHVSRGRWRSRSPVEAGIVQACIESSDVQSIVQVAY